MLKGKTKDTLIFTGRIIIRIGSVLLLIWFFIWLGLKGVVGLLSGLAIMAFLLLSKNPLVKMLVDMFHASRYLDSFFENYDEGEKDDEKEKEIKT